MNEQNLSGQSQLEPADPGRAPRPVNDGRRKKIFWVALGIIILALAVGALFILTQRRDNPRSDQPNQQGNSQKEDVSAQSAFLNQYRDTCKEREATFTSAPMKLSDIGIIRPLGAMLDGHVTPTDHVYIGGTNPNAPDNSYPVLMPADGTIVEVAAMPAQYIGDRSGQQLAPEDHRIVISHSCRYFSIYIHIHKLGDKLKSAVGTLQPEQNKRISVDLKAGETVGYIGNSTFDWTPIDTTKTLSGFIHPDLYKGEAWKIHTISPFDLYTGELKANLEAKSLRNTAPLGGKIDYDQPGKLIGNWFREGSGGYTGKDNNGGRYWDSHLAIVPDYIHPDSTIVSIGNWQGQAKQFVVSGFAEPAKVEAKTGIVTYELKTFSYINSDGFHSPGNIAVKGLRPSQNGEFAGTIALQVMPGEKLKVETFPGKTANQVSGFTAAVQIYER